MEPIRWRVHIPAPPANVFRALDSEEGRAGFWSESALERDGVIRFEFSNGPAYEARVLERDPPRRFSLLYFGGPATFDLAPDGKGGTDVSLVHAGVPEEEWLETYAGWLNVLLPLKAYVAFGVDLKNRDPSRSWDAGYVDS